MTLSSINWHDLTTGKFWFYVDPYQIHNGEHYLFYIGGVLVILGIILMLVGRFTANQFLARVEYWVARILIMTGVIEAIWYLLRFENATAIGSKFVGALILLIGILWLYYPLKYLLRNYKEDMERAEREANRQKYLNRKR